MTEQELQTIIQKIKQQDELPYIEVKVDLNNLNQIGKTISALSNSASWKDEEYAYFIWGIEDGTWKIVGTKFDISKTKKPKKDKSESNQNGELWLNSTFNVIPHIEQKREFYIEGKRLYVLKIKNCGNIPICFAKSPYIRIGSHNQELLKYPEIHRQILNKNQNPDWSAQICDKATIEDLDIEAVEMARIVYIKKWYSNEPEMAGQVRKFDTIRVLDEFMMLTKDKKITNTCLLLLGKKHSKIKLGCGFSTIISYLNLDDTTDDDDYDLPFQKSITSLVNKIRNKPIELSMQIAQQYVANKTNGLYNYDKNNIRECIANCVAHQDYTKHQKIEVYESINKTVSFRNAGACIYTKSEFELIRQRKIKPSKYRNEFLANAMVQIGLMEAKGTGHQKLFNYNTKQVFLPLPDINWKDKQDFDMIIYGSVKDPNFGKILELKADLEPQEILLLDQVQKTGKINKIAFEKLNKKGLVGGSPTNCYLGLDVAIMISGADAIGEKQTREEFDIEKCIESVYKFVKECNNKNVVVKSQNMFNKIKKDISIISSDSSESKKINYFNNHIIKKMKVHSVYKIKKIGGGKDTNWIALSTQNNL